MRSLRLLAAPLVAVLGLAACGSKDKPAERTATPRAPAASATPQTDASGCRKAPRPKPKGKQHLPKPSLQLSAAKRYTATVKTSCGDLQIALDVKRAPKTTASFVSLGRLKFYDGTTFTRVVPGFVIQGGDPLGTGRGGPGYTVVEPPPPSLRYTRGVVAMAKTPTDPAGASGSQFFVVTGEDARLPPDFALLGKVVKGQDVVDTIGTVPTVRTTEAPLSPVLIDSITVAER